MKNFNDLEHIKAYLEGNLSKSDLKDFKAQLASDSDLKSEVEAYRKIFNGFQYLKEEAFESNVKEWGTELRKKDIRLPIESKSAKIRSLYRRMAVAASTVLLLGLGTTFWAGHNFSNDALVAKQYEAPISTRTLGEPGEGNLKEVQDQFTAAHLLFQENKNQDALNAFQNLTNYLETNKSNIDELEWSYYFENIEWTSALILLKSGQENGDEFKNLLDKITDNSNHSYTNQANKLKSDLNSFWRKLAL